MSVATPVGHSPKTIWRSATAWVAASLVLLALGVVALWPSSPSIALDPQTPNASGAQALAQVLKQKGVTLTVARSDSDMKKQLKTDAAATVVVTDTGAGIGRAVPKLLQRANVKRVVLLAPAEKVLKQLNTGLVPAGDTVALADPPAHCRGIFGKAKQLSIFGEGYKPEKETEQGTFRCLSSPDTAQVFLLPKTSKHPQLLVLGNAKSFSNSAILEEDNAAAALAATSPTNRVVWYSPTQNGDAPISGADQLKPVNLLPKWFAPALALLAWAFLLFAFYKGRRFGRLATEELPVIVKACETTQALGRMYASSKDYRQMIATLQTELRPRLSTALFLPSLASKEELLTALTRKTRRQKSDLAYLLYGSPNSESEMVSMARGLTALEQEVIRERN